MYLICGLVYDVWNLWRFRFYQLFENNNMLWVQLSSIGVKIDVFEVLELCGLAEYA